MGLEEERKYEAGPEFGMPDLAGCAGPDGRVVARRPVTLTATYFDTEDLRLARAGASLRHRQGDRRAWTVKLPTGTNPPTGATTGIRHEISRGAPAGTPPDELVALVTALHRGAPLRPVVVVRTRRTRYDVLAPGDTRLAEVADDTVTVLPAPGAPPTARFREIEVERIAGERAVLDRIEATLVAAGATAGSFTPKHVRALGPAATEPPEVPATPPLPRQPRAADVAVTAIRRAVHRIADHDPLLRLRQDLPDGDTPVHQMRVGCRRLRSDLRTFRMLVDAGWAAPLREELRWLAGSLGEARDAEVLRSRLRRLAAADPLAPPDPSAVERIDAELAARQHEALEAVDAALASPRYLALLDRLAEAAVAPRLTPLAAASAREVLPELVSRAWYRLAHGSKRGPGAAGLSPEAPDADWHAVRINGKRARYAVEAAAVGLGGPARKLAKRLARVQDLLGEHQDAAVAAETWVAIASSDPDDHPLAVTAGRLYERERATIRRLRAQFPRVWKAADRPALLEWLR